MSDRLHDTLSTLRTDLDRAPLADSSAVRARGNQRTRRQAVGTSLAVVALVAGVIGVSGALTGNNKANNLPADPTTSQTPSPDPTVKTRLVIGPDVLLGVDELAPVPNQTFSVGETLDPATSADTEERSLMVCDDAPNGGQTPESALLRTFPSDLDAYTWQWVAQYATAEEARAAFAALELNCPPPDTRGSTDSLSGLPQGTEGVRYSVFSSDPDSEFFGELQGVVLRDDVLLVLSLRGMLQEGDVDQAEFNAAVVRAAERLSQ